MNAADSYPALARIPQGIGVECIQDAEDQAERALAELDELRRWKAEAMRVLADWDVAWHAAGRPGRLGSSKARALAVEVDRLRSDCKAWMNGVADAVEPLGFDREAACGPADLLPGLAWLVPEAATPLAYDPPLAELVISAAEAQGIALHEWQERVVRRLFPQELIDELDQVSEAHADDPPTGVEPITFRSTGRGAHEVIENRAEGPARVLAMVQFTEGVRGWHGAMERLTAHLASVSQDGAQ